MPQRALLLLALAMCPACTGQTITPIDLTDTAFDYGFLVLLDESEQTLYFSEAFRTPPDPDGALPVVKDQPDAAFAHVVGLQKSGLQSLVPDFDPALWAQLRLLDRPPPSAAEYSTDAAQAMLPPDSSSLRAELGGLLKRAPLEPLSERTTLNVPIRAEQCRPQTLSPLLPLGPMQHQVGPAEDDHLAVDLVRAAPLDASRIVALAQRALYVFVAGEGFAERPITADQRGTSLRTETIPQVVDFEGLLVRGNRVLTAGVGRSDTVLIELAYEANALRWVSTSSAVDLKAIDIAWAEDGGVLLLGEDGSLVSIRNGAPDRPLPALKTEGQDASRLIDTGDPDRPYLAASVGLIHLFDRAETRWVTQRVARAADEGEASIDALLARRGEDGIVELWAGTESFGLYRKRGDAPWERLDSLRLPPRMMGCSMGQYPAQRSIRDILDLVVFEDQILATIEECSGLIMFRPGEDCVSMLTIGGEVANFVSDDLTSAAVIGGSIVVVGEQGRAFVAQPVDPP